MSGKKDLLDFKVDGKSVKVHKGDGTSDVYYTKAGGSTTSTGLKYVESEGMYKNATTGALLTRAEAEKYITDKI